MLECVINISEGRRLDVVAAIGAAAGAALLDVHTDADHHRSVLTLAGAGVEDAAFAVVAETAARIDLRHHAGVHPRLGAADVVPFVPLAGSTMADAVAARDALAARIERELGVPCVVYGPERSLPDVRRHAADEQTPHPTAGICCVGARPVLVAYNLWLATPATVEDARRIAGEIRSPALRTLGLAVGDDVQVSCNLIDPAVTGPDAAFDAVAARAPVARAELVGLVPAAVLDRIPATRWPELDLAPERTIEARLSQAGLDGGRFASGGGGTDERS
jgi:glutamate formiminotransferase/glutamate formiminotransferase/formiminotetrahydrofolate cyclodeaminase